MCLFSRDFDEIINHNNANKGGRNVSEDVNSNGKSDAKYEHNLSEDMNISNKTVDKRKCNSGEDIHTNTESKLKREHNSREVIDSNVKSDAMKREYNTNEDIKAKRDVRLDYNSRENANANMNRNINIPYSHSFNSRNPHYNPLINYAINSNRYQQNRVSNHSVFAALNPRLHQLIGKSVQQLATFITDDNSKEIITAKIILWALRIEWKKKCKQKT